MSYTRGFFALLILVGSLFYFRDTASTFVLQAYREVAPCSTPITYSIDVIDAGFRTSTSTLERALKNAEEVWEGAIARDLFTYVPSGGEIRVSLAYDVRQATTQTLAKLGISVDANMQTYEQMRDSYLALSKQYESQKSTFENTYAAFERDVAAYEAQVKRWNDRGGAPQSVYDELEATQKQLKNREIQLQQLQGAMNENARSINALVKTLNVLAHELNVSVATYNSVGESVGGEFEEALYESRPGSRTITVFEFDDEARLTRLLAHEMGHALGLEHIDEPSAIMYRLNQSKNSVATKADTEALRVQCRISQ